MTLILELSPAEEAALTQQAESAGVPTEDFARRKIFGDLDVDRQAKKRYSIGVLQSWIDEAENSPPEEREAADKEWRETMAAFDEDRGDDRKIFQSLLS